MKKDPHFSVGCCAGSLLTLCILPSLTCCSALAVESRKVAEPAPAAVLIGTMLCAPSSRTAAAAADGGSADSHSAGLAAGVQPSPRLCSQRHKQSMLANQCKGAGRTKR